MIENMMESKVLTQKGQKAISSIVVIHVFQGQISDKYAQMLQYVSLIVKLRDEPYHWDVSTWKKELFYEKMHLYCQTNDNRLCILDENILS